MPTFQGTPNMLVRIVNPIGPIKHIRFNAEGTFTTDNERLSKRLQHKFSVVQGLSCKKCEFATENKGLLMSHYREFHPKEG